MELVIEAWEILILCYFFAYNTVNLVLMIIAWGKVRYFLNLKQSHYLDIIFKMPSVPQVSLIIPSYNESVNIVESISSLLALRYPKIEIIVVNDGSTDATSEVFVKAFKCVRRDLHYAEQLKTSDIESFYESTQVDERGYVKRLVLINKKNGGKSDALNAGVNLATSPYVCCIDAETLMDENALLEVMYPIIQDPEKIIACGGQVGLSNGSKFVNGKLISLEFPKNPLAAFQVVEYLRSFTFGRTGLAAIDSLLILSGAFAVFKTDLIIEVGGFLSGKTTKKIVLEYCGNKKAICEDMEIIVRIYRFLLEKKIRSKIQYLPYPIVWTQAPNNLKNYGRQRSRWYAGLLEVLAYHKVMLFNPVYRQMGLFALPFQFFFEGLGPIVELTGYITVPIFYFMGLLSTEIFYLFIAVSIMYSVAVCLFSVLIGYWSEGQIQKERDFIKLFQYRGYWQVTRIILYALLSPFYRQLQLVFQLKGLLHFLFDTVHWGEQTRDKI